MTRVRDENYSNLDNALGRRALAYTRPNFVANHLDLPSSHFERVFTQFKHHGGRCEWQNNPGFVLKLGPTRHGRKDPGALDGLLWPLDLNPADNGTRPVLRRRCLEKNTLRAEKRSFAFNNKPRATFRVCLELEARGFVKDVFSPRPVGHALGGLIDGHVKPCAPALIVVSICRLGGTFKLGGLVLNGFSGRGYDESKQEESCCEVHQVRPRRKRWTWPTGSRLAGASLVEAFWSMSMTMRGPRKLATA